MDTPQKPKLFTTTRGFMQGGHAVWQFTAGTWVLKKDASEEGYVCGGPPQENGKFEGELRKTACVAKSHSSGEK